MRAAEQPPERVRPTIPNWEVPPSPGPGPAPTEAAPRLPFLAEPFAASLDNALLQRRVVAISGALDTERATDSAARLLHLDAASTGDITVRLDCDHADVSAALMLVDTFGSLRADVHVVVVGQAAGAAVVVIAAADSASIYPHARVVLTEPDLPSVQGDATHLDAQLAEQQRLVAAAYDVIARRCGRSRDEFESDARHRRLLTATEAVDYRLVDRVE